MEILFSLAIIVVGVLNVILFFKVWGMCNNVARLTEKITPKTDDEIKADNEKKENTYAYIFVGFIGIIMILFVLYNFLG